MQKRPASRDSLSPNGDSAVMLAVRCLNMAGPKPTRPCHTSPETPPLPPNMDHQKARKIRETWTGLRRSSENDHAMFSKARSQIHGGHGCGRPLRPVSGELGTPMHLRYIGTLSRNSLEVCARLPSSGIDESQWMPRIRLMVAVTEAPPSLVSPANFRSSSDLLVPP